MGGFSGSLVDGREEIVHCLEDRRSQQNRNVEECGLERLGAEKRHYYRAEYQHNSAAPKEHHRLNHTECRGVEVRGSAGISLGNRGHSPRLRENPDNDSHQIREFIRERIQTVCVVADESRYHKQIRAVDYPPHNSRGHKRNAVFQHRLVQSLAVVERVILAIQAACGIQEHDGRNVAQYHGYDISRDAPFQCAKRQQAVNYRGNRGDYAVHRIERHGIARTDVYRADLLYTSGEYVQQNQPLIAPQHGNQSHYRHKRNKHHTPDNTNIYSNRKHHFSVVAFFEGKPKYAVRDGQRYHRDQQRRGAYNVVHNTIAVRAERVRVEFQHYIHEHLRAELPYRQDNCITCQFLVLIHFFSSQYNLILVEPFRCTVTTF